MLILTRKIGEVLRIYRALTDKGWQDPAIRVRKSLKDRGLGSTRVPQKSPP
jgi:hypothetical protein